MKAGENGNYGYAHDRHDQIADDAAESLRHHQGDGTMTDISKATPKLVTGEVTAIDEDGNEGISYIDAVIHFEDDSHGEICIHCSGAPRIADLIVLAVNERGELIAERDALKADVGRMEAERDALKADNERLRKAMYSVAGQCGNVIFNCEQMPTDNDRHLDSWRSVKEYALAALSPQTEGSK